MKEIMLTMGMIGGIIVGAVAISFVTSWPVYMLWNSCLVDAIDGIKQVTWLQAWGIAVLCALLFTTRVSKVT
jgi:hypothetical protein